MFAILRRSSLVLLVILVLTLAACGGATQEQEPAAEEAAAQPTEMMAEVEPTAAMDEMATETMDEMAPTEEAMEEMAPTEEAMEEMAPTEEAMEEMAPTEETMADEDMAAMDPLMLDGTAAGLRVALNRLLGEHVLLAASATNAALDGRTADFEAAAAELDNNSVDLTSAITAVYGEEAGASFLEQWREHIGFFVDYTTATAAGDTDGQQAAVDDLVAYTTSFAEFLSGATGVPAAALEENLQMHVLGLKAVVDAQAAGDETAHYTSLREAYAHMAMTAEALSGAIAGQQPEMFTGDGMASAAELRVALNNLLAEHTFLAATATDEALNGNTPGFEAAAAALDENSVELAGAITSVYGEEAGAEFLDQWRAHIGFFVDYTTASAAGDEAGQTEAVENLGSYITGFAAFLAGATGLPQDALEAGLQEHVMGLAMVVDAQAAEDPTAAYGELRTAYLHMQALGDALSGAIAGQFPEMFPMEGTSEG